MKDSYPSEKFYTAVRSLVQGTGSIQDRVAAAFVESLSVFQLEHQAGLDADTVRKLKEYAEAQSSTVDAVREGKTAVWAISLSDDEAVEIATWILETWEHLEREYLQS